VGVALVTGSSGLIGSQTVESLVSLGFNVVGVDNDMRSFFFGKESSTKWNQERLSVKFPKHFIAHDVDIRHYEALEGLFKQQRFDLVVHAAAQPSHDWAAQDPITDFSINAVGTLYLLELTRKFSPNSSFVLMSTNKVYGDAPNTLPLIENEYRWDLPEDSLFFKGINENFQIDHSLHSVFGASKVSADIMTQEYGRYFGMNTLILRGGCLTGPMHSASQLHGFLSHLVKSYVKNKTYTIFGHKGKQVRDNIHARDVVTLILEFHKSPTPALVLNIGGGRENSISILEAINKLHQISNRDKFNVVYDEKARLGDHIWYISNLSKAKNLYPNWELTYGIDDLINEMYEMAMIRD
jgi:CDP-paratose 2-epimerase